MSKERSRILWVQRLIGVIIFVWLILLFVVDINLYFPAWFICFTQHLNDWINENRIVWYIIVLILTYIISNHFLVPHLVKINSNFFNALKIRLLREMPNDENTFSLFDDFTGIKFEEDPELGPHFSLNGLIGRNNECASLNITDEELSTFIEKISNYQACLEQRIGQNNFVKNDEEWNELRRIYSVESLQVAINATTKELEDSDNTFRFIANQFGISNLKSGLDGNIIAQYYKTTYYTFKVINRLFIQNYSFFADLIIRLKDNIHDDNIRKDGFCALFPLFSSLGINIIIDGETEKYGHVLFKASRSRKVFDHQQRGQSSFHVPMNETLSFTDIDMYADNIPDINRCVSRGFQEEIGLKISVHDLAKDLKLHDIFINPERGMLGLSGHYHLGDLNPHEIKYYPGVDKVLEYNDLGILKLTNKYKLLNKQLFKNADKWIPYTPFLYKRYYIRETNFIQLILIGNSSIRRSILAYLFWAFFNVLALGGLLIYYRFQLNYNGFLLSLLDFLSSAYITIFLLLLYKYIVKRIEIYKQRRKHPFLKSFGLDPYSENVIMYSGDNGIKVDNILFSIHFDSSISKQLDDESLKKTNISILNYEARIRKIEYNDECPTLLLKCNYKEPQSISSKVLFIRNYYYGCYKGEFYLVYFEENKKIQFGKDFRIFDQFDLERYQYKNFLSEHTKKALGTSDKHEIYNLALDNSNNNLFDIYSKYTNNEKEEIFITNLVENEDYSLSTAKIIKAISKNDLKVKILEFIENPSNTHKIDELDILMLQQLLVRKGIILLKTIKKDKWYKTIYNHLKTFSMKNLKKMDSAIISESAQIGDNCLIGNNVTIGDNVRIGSNVKIWDNAYVRPEVIIGNNCIIARGVYVDAKVVIGNNVKIQNRNNISAGVEIEDGVFIGPNVTFSNDKYPRSVNPDETLKSGHDWVCVETKIKKGSSLGAGCVIVCGITVGEWSMVGAGAVVTKNVPANALVVGNPARIISWVSKSGKHLKYRSEDSKHAILYSEDEELDYLIPLENYRLTVKK